MRQGGGLGPHKAAGRYRVHGDPEVRQGWANGEEADLGDRIGQSVCLETSTVALSRQVTKLSESFVSPLLLPGLTWSSSPGL